MAFGEYRFLKMKFYKFYHFYYRKKITVTCFIASYKLYSMKFNIIWKGEIILKFM